MTLKIRLDPNALLSAPFDGQMDVVCDMNGTLTLTADAATMATLAGRTGFRDRAYTQMALADRIATAWYAADCPRGEA